MIRDGDVVWFNANGFSDRLSAVGVVLSHGPMLGINNEAFFISNRDSWYLRSESELQKLTDEELMLWKLEGNTSVFDENKSESML